MHLHVVYMTVVILFKLYFPFFETHLPHITVPTKRGKINFEPMTVLVITSLAQSSVPNFHTDIISIPKLFCN